MVAPFDMDTILKPTVLKASVSNAGEVSFVVKDTAKGKQLTLPAAKGSDGFYTAQLTQKEMDQIGKTDVASITLVADGKELSTITNLSIGKEKDKAPAGVLENFDYYVGSNGLLDAAYGGNSAAGCSSSFTLDQEHKADGTYGAAFNYKLKTTGSEVWTGLVNASLGNTDFSAYNALKFWTKLDGKGQKVPASQDRSVLVTVIYALLPMVIFTIPRSCSQASVAAGSSASPPMYYGSLAWLLILFCHSSSKYG